MPCKFFDWICYDLTTNKDILNKNVDEHEINKVELSEEFSKLQES